MNGEEETRVSAVHIQTETPAMVGVPAMFIFSSLGKRNGERVAPGVAGAGRRVRGFGDCNVVPGRGRVPGAVACCLAAPGLAEVVGSVPALRG